MEKRCNAGIWDDTVPGIFYDSAGESNYSKMLKSMMSAYPKGEIGKKDFDKILAEVKANKKSKYHCIIGVSGGTDSCYLLHLAKEYGLNPLAVNLDNGFSSEIAYNNIQKVTNALGIDLETYVVDYEEMKDLLLSYIKAGMPWADAPTDLAIVSLLYKIAAKEKIKYIFTGSDFRSEGKQPVEWTYYDSRQLKSIQKKFGSKKVKSLPVLSPMKVLYYNFVKGFKIVYPFYYVEYQKKEAQKLLIEKYNWVYYGGHHHENSFTKFAIADWMKYKFNIDKRIITLSAQVVSGEITREQALEMIAEPPYDLKEMAQDRSFIIKKLGITEEEFKVYWERPNNNYLTYKSYYPIFKKLAKITIPILKYILPVKPKILFEMENRKQ